MSVYSPDKWVILKIAAEGEETTYKILAGWYGGFAGSNSWKLSSGITTIEHDPEFNQTHYHQSSGSTYICSKGTYGFSSITQNKFLNWVKQGEENSFTIEAMPEGFEVPSNE